MNLIYNKQKMLSFRKKDLKAIKSILKVVKQIDN